MFSHVYNHVFQDDYPESVDIDMALERTIVHNLIKSNPSLLPQILHSRNKSIPSLQVPGYVLGEQYKITIITLALIKYKAVNLSINTLFLFFLPPLMQWYQTLENKL